MSRFFLWLGIFFCMLSLSILLSSCYLELDPTLHIGGYHGHGHGHGRGHKKHHRGH